MSAPQLGLAIAGDLREQMAAERRIVARAVRVAPERAAREGKEEYRSHVRQAFGRAAGRRGRKFENAIRDKAYHDGEFRHAALIYSKFGRREGGRFIDYLVPYDRGGVIKAKGRYMVIPAKGTSRRVRRDLRDLKRLDEDPKLALIPQPGGRFLFVRHTSSRRTVIIAWLIRRFTRRKVLNLQGVHDAIGHRYEEILVEEMERGG
ncbi:MAG: hypothetical protein Kow00114_35970 [Kiloniellaceae bacterium]